MKSEKSHKWLYTFLSHCQSKLPCTVVTKSAIVIAKTTLAIEAVDVAEDDVVLVADVEEVVRLRRLRQSKNDGSV